MPSVSQIRSVASQGRRMGRLGRGVGGRVRIAATVARFRRARLRGEQVQPVTLPLAYDGVPFDLVVTSASDLEVLREVFLDGEYSGYDAQPEVIVDLGANIGVSVWWFAIAHPAARIFAVEPDPRAFALLERNTAALPNVRAVHAAVAAQDGDVPFFTGEETWTSSTVAHQQATREITVPGRTLDGLLEEWGVSSPDLLKIDIEGAEYEVLRSSGVLESVPLVLGEYHRSFCPASCEEFTDLLRTHGFEVSLARAEENIPFVATRTAASPVR